MEIDQEPEPKQGGTPPAYWPSSGELSVENLSARYSQVPIMDSLLMIFVTESSSLGWPLGLEGYFLQR